MSTLPSNAWSSYPTPPAGGSATSGLPVLIRTVRKQDLPGLADLLANSFHHQDGMVGWLYPLLRAGIYEDLRTRIQTRHKNYACLVASQPLTSSEIEQTNKAQRSLHLTPTHPVFLSTLPYGDRPLGTVEITLKTPPPWQSPHIRYLYLSNLAVHPESRRQGIAQQLLKTCEQVAQDWGYQDLYLHVLENNSTARRLYVRAGYRIMRIETSLSSWLLGRPRQLFLHKHLSQD